MPKKLRHVPKFANESQERSFWESHDTADYFDLSKAVRARVPNLKPSTTTISLRLPVSLLEQIKIAANKRDVPYQSLIKMWLAEKVGEANFSNNPGCRFAHPGHAFSSGSPTRCSSQRPTSRMIRSVGGTGPTGTSSPTE